ncbi:MAG: DNA starvation/stationary phase protection protein [Alphaproteobacteria bacterium]|nr:DNA starvation/stationary phase protection protein [Alphaproteobacteria bacterium]NCQ88907.1 DNA starvation/stationary phase protection protein [Alphaproteobacteria bacterium]NCT07810.1 DNA starvation/stationary phase protection protein [Alphaproteobacteria bacterium]
MHEPATLHQPKATESPISKNLQKVLANTYGLYLATHNYHWNVEGLHFVSMHKLFSEQYNELFQAIDVIAERIRALDFYALPFEGKEILDTLQKTSNAMNKEADANARAMRMVHNLIEMNDSVIESCQSAKKEGQNSKDDETIDLMVRRITAHQKSIWMLRSIIK